MCWRIWSKTTPTQVVCHDKNLCLQWLWSSNVAELVALVQRASGSLLVSAGLFDVSDPSLISVTWHLAGFHWKRLEDHLGFVTLKAQSFRQVEDWSTESNVKCNASNFASVFTVFCYYSAAISFFTSFFTTTMEGLAVCHRQHLTSQWTSNSSFCDGSIFGDGQVRRRFETFNYIYIFILYINFHSFQIETSWNNMKHISE